MFGFKSGKNKPVVKSLCSIADPSAPFNYVEAYKMLCTNIEFIRVTQKCKNIMITSTLANEGKTNIAVNLALTLSGYDKSVCLVECDLRRPTVHRFIASNKNSYGLTNVLKGQVELDSVLHKVSGTMMSILLAGSIPPNPSELLASPNMKALVDDLEQKFDYVIYDTPPVFLVTDAAALGKYMDGAVFVIKHNATEKGMVVQAKKNLEIAGVNIFGAIYSTYSAKSSGSYSKYSRYNYYDYYSSYSSNPDHTSSHHSHHSKKSGSNNSGDDDVVEI